MWTETEFGKSRHRRFEQEQLMELFLLLLGGFINSYHSATVQVRMSYKFSVMRTSIYLKWKNNEIVVLLSEQGRRLSRSQRGEAGCVPTGFRYARHSDEPLKRKTLGVWPSCFPGLISTAYIHPPGTQPAFPPYYNIFMVNIPYSQ